MYKIGDKVVLKSFDEIKDSCDRVDEIVNLSGVVIGYHMHTNKEMFTITLTEARILSRGNVTGEVRSAVRRNKTSEEKYYYTFNTTFGILSGIPQEFILEEALAAEQKSFKDSIVDELSKFEKLNIKDASKEELCLYFAIKEVLGW